MIWAVLGIAVWFLLALGVGRIIGRTITLRDRHDV